MKKSVVLAMAMALGVTASAYAANPFSDVPAGHWAYDSISKLAAAGVIEGYGDDTFRGDRLMTRYEMAQIVARAMAKGANVDKLAAEFADELNALGVRVAALEKKSDNVKITGEIRYHWARSNRNYLDTGSADGRRGTGLRSRLYINGQINDNWKYVGRIQNQQWFDNDGADNGTAFNVAKVEGRLGGVNILAGHEDDVFANGYIYDGEHDVIKASYGSKWYVSGAYGKLNDLNDGSIPPAYYSKKFAAVEVGSNIEDAIANGKVGYLRANLGPDAQFQGGKIGIWYLGADINVAKDLVLSAMYLRSNKDIHNNVNTSKNGYVFGLSYKGADEGEPGSWGLSARYYNQGRGTYLKHTIDGFTDWDSGFKGWSVGGDVGVAKNMVLGVTYYETKAKSQADTKTKTLWTEFNITF